MKSAETVPPSLPRAERSPQGSGTRRLTLARPRWYRDAMEHIAILGSGVVGQSLADGFLRHGYAVMRGSREPSKLEAWRADAGPNARVGTFEACVASSDLVVLAVKGSVAEELVRSLSLALAGKVVIDTTNPIAASPPKDGVIAFFTGPNESLLERLQAAAPDARFVKAFSCVGNAFMVDPPFAEKPTMFFCGDDDAARERVSKLLIEFGWDPSDMGTSAAARAIEPLCMLWCIPGLRSGTWTHAFRLVR